MKFNPLWILTLFLASCGKSPSNTEAPLQPEPVVSEKSEHQRGIQYNSATSQDQTSDASQIMRDRAVAPAIEMANTDVDLELENFAHGFEKQKVPQNWYEKASQKVRSQIDSRNFHIQETSTGNFRVGVKVEGEFVTWPGAYEFPVNDTFETRKYFQGGKSKSIKF